MNILITGATGFLGFHIATILKDQGHNVLNFSRSHTNELTDIGVETIKGDITNIDDIDKALKGIDVIFNVASKVGMWGKWNDFYKINYEGTKNLVDLAKKNNIQYFIHTSTPSVVFGKEAIENGNEELPYPNEYLSLYAKSKALGERYVLENASESFKCCSLRPHLIYGKRDKNIIPRIIEARKKNKLKIIGDGHNIVDVIHVENAAWAHIDAFNELLSEAKNNGKAYFIAQEKPVKLWVFINNILEVKGLKRVTKKISLKASYSLGLVIELFLKLFKIYNIHPPMTRFVALQLGTSHYFSHKRAQEDFNYKVRITLEDSLKEI